MDHLGSRLQSTAAMHRSAPGAPAVAEFAVQALSSRRPRIAEQKTILKQVVVEIPKNVYQKQRTSTNAGKNQNQNIF